MKRKESVQEENQFRTSTGDAMKSSFYNIFIPIGTNKYILYNTLSDCILLADTELKEALESTCDIPDEQLAVLKRTGMVIDDTFQEEKIFSYLYNSKKFNTSETYFTFLPTYACNLQCPYCYEKAGTILSHSMDKKTAENVSIFMEKMVEENRSRDILLKFYGGEPLLNTDVCFTIYDALSQLSDKDFHLILQTNGTLLTEEIIERFSDHLAAAEMTLEGDKDYHDTIRVYKKGGGTYEDIMNSINRLLESDNHVTVRINASEPVHLDLLLKDLNERGIKGKNFSFYITQTSDFGLGQFFTDDASCLHDEERAVTLIPELRAVVNDHQFNQNLMTYDTLQRQKIIACNSERKAKYVIDPYGDVYLCFFTAGQKEFSVGTIKEEGNIVWNPSFYEIIARNPLDFSECRYCKLLPMCGGGCHIRAFNQKGSYFQYHCGNTKEMAEKRVKLYLQQKYPQRFGGLL